MRACHLGTLCSAKTFAHETERSLAAGKAARQKPPARFLTDRSKQALVNAAELEWRQHSALTDQHASILDACSAGFALSSQPGQQKLWGRVKDRAQTSITAEVPWAELEDVDDEVLGLDHGVLNFTESASKNDTRFIMQVIEIVAGACPCPASAFEATACTPAPAACSHFCSHFCCA